MITLNYLIHGGKTLQFLLIASVLILTCYLIRDFPSFYFSVCNEVFNLRQFPDIFLLRLKSWKITCMVISSKTMNPWYDVSGRFSAAACSFIPSNMCWCRPGDCLAVFFFRRRVLPDGNLKNPESRNSSYPALDLFHSLRHASIILQEIKSIIWKRNL